MTKVAAPKATKVLVRKPARRLRHWRSNPMTALRPTAIAKLIAASPMEIVIALSPSWMLLACGAVYARTTAPSPSATESSSSIEQLERK